MRLAIAILGSAVLVAAIVADALSHTHIFTVRNASAIELDDVVIRLAGSRVSTGRLAPGAVTTVKLWSPESGGLAVEIRGGIGTRVTMFPDVRVSRRTGLVVEADFQAVLDWKRPGA
jgi:hypothetical protein